MPTALNSAREQHVALPTPDDRSHVDVLFVDLPFNTYELGHRFKSAWSYKQFLSPYELHLGFRYMVSFLRDRGYTADILFPATENGLTSRAALVDAIAEIDPLILGFTSYEGSFKESVQFIRQVKAAGIRSLICVGGHLATFSYEEILHDFSQLVDVIVLGEGEHTIAELAGAVKTNQNLRGLPGIAYVDGGRVVATDRRPVEPDPSTFPFPLIPSREGWQENNIPLFLTTSRGCYGRCSFCRSSHYGEGWRARDAGNVVDEMEYACKQGVSTFEIVDDNFVGPGAAGRRRATAVAAEIQQRELQIQYHVSCRVNDVDETTMRAMRDSGLISVSLGVESGVQRVLDTFNKNITVEQSVAALELLNRLEIPVLVYIIFFDPYMTLSEVRENLQFLRRIRSIGNVRFEPVIFRRLIPISGTAIFDQLRRDGLLRGNYLAGHYFAFSDRRVSILADFMEIIDLRFEHILQSRAFRQIEGLYGSFKAVFEFSLAERATELLSSANWREEEANARLEDLLSEELRRAFGHDLHRAAFTQ